MPIFISFVDKDKLEFQNNSKTVLAYTLNSKNNSAEEKAELLSSKNNTYVKFKWLENDDDCFFEIKITVDEITKDVSLIIIDFADNDEVEEAKMLWESQISDLKSVIGSS